MSLLMSKTFYLGEIMRVRLTFDLVGRMLAEDLSNPAVWIESYGRTARIQEMNDCLTRDGIALALHAGIETVLLYS